jgi:hypothetical protein
MKAVILILFFIAGILVAPVQLSAQKADSTIQFEFYGDTIQFQISKSFIVEFEHLSEDDINQFYKKILNTNYASLMQALKKYKTSHKADDWLYYQLIRKTAQQISAKADNYNRYTLYKWFLLTQSGYDAILTYAGEQLLFYVRSNENIYNIPSRIKNDKQYVCLNYHDYTNVDFDKYTFKEIVVDDVQATKIFSYKITQLPEFRPGNYLEKDIRFNYYENDHHFKIKLNPEIKTIFANYPVLDYEYYFNIPLSRETYSTLIPALKEKTKNLSAKKGVDYLMRFTRYAFLFEKDSINFGSEKRLSPEQTLLYEYSDCEDRSALFFYLVKEIYNLPMIVLTFPTHVTMAVYFEKPMGKPVLYNGKEYTICEPTPQQRDLRMGELIRGLRRTPYEVAYVYNPL